MSSLLLCLYVAAAACSICHGFLFTGGQLARDTQWAVNGVPVAKYTCRLPCQYQGMVLNPAKVGQAVLPYANAYKGDYEEIKNEIEQVRERIRKQEEEVGKAETAIANDEVYMGRREKALVSYSDLLRGELKELRGELKELRGELKELRRKENLLMEMEGRQQQQQLPNTGPSAYTERKDLFQAAKDVQLPDSLPSAVSVGPLLRELFGVPSSLLFVRSQYILLFDLLPFGNRHNLALTGTPGIAKSVSLLYILIRRVQDGHPTCFHDLRFRSTYVFANGTCLAYKGDDELTGSNELVVLLDNPKGNPTLYPRNRNGLSIMASSPREENMAEWLKEGGVSFGRLYMPLWTLCELKAFWKQIHRLECDEAGNCIAGEDVERRFERVGGVIRPLFAPSSAFNEYCSLLAYALNDEGLIKAVGTFKSGFILKDQGEYSNKAIHYRTDKDFTLIGLHFCSATFFEDWRRQRRDRTVDVLFGGKWKEGEGFEKAVVMFMPSCTELLFRDLTDKKPGLVFERMPLVGPLEVLKNLADSDIDDWLDKNPAKSMLLVPKVRNYESFDAFLWDQREWRPLQVTVNAQKVLKPLKLQQFFNQHPQLPLKWYGVVPSAVALRGSRFSMETGRKRGAGVAGQKAERVSDEDSQEGSKEILLATAAHAWAKQYLKQYVIPFPGLDSSLEEYPLADYKVLYKMVTDIYARLGGGPVVPGEPENGDEGIQ